MEYYYDKKLRGQENSLVILKDALGRGFAKEKKATEKKVTTVDSAKNLVLTIDRTIQFITENALDEAVTQFSAESGMAIVMDPQTGAVLAMANNPLFNPNTFGRFPRGSWRNRAITDPFEPGSTMKIFTAAAALESGTCTPSSIFFCENGVYHIGKNVIHDTHPRGWLSLQQIVKFSSNIGVVKVIESIGPDSLHRTLTNFGFGEKTHLDCPGETSGVLIVSQTVDTGRYRSNFIWAGDFGVCASTGHSGFRNCQQWKSHAALHRCGHNRPQRPDIRANRTPGCQDGGIRQNSRIS